ncbi:aromatase/cyclase [Streptomyces sp. Li-HN-5-11]|uniref:aromatase/cyclase n=1 Tax=Streptomyces sp. Li-HN-5-11 TaxID=3075432 RepID=UPI0028A85D19|nr:aromatase/cyclase [Streptomyces sp. Li-HN-5-11]WNM31345.1 aromatase/cyclase [Streptomyces sp. Li-HN-5-11]
MTDTAVHETEHEIVLSAPPQVVFDLLAEVSDWPCVFPPTVHADYLERGEREERIRLWATANDEVKSWTSRRELDRGRLRIRFRQEVSQSPVAAMGGEWVIERQPSGRTRVRLKHDFRAVGDEPANVAWIRQAIDRNSAAELGSLEAAADRALGGEDLLLSFEDQVRVDGPAKRVYDFLYAADSWPERLPHVARVELTETTPNVQILEMDTSTADGSVHTTRSVRVCFPDDRIVYKQLRTPALMSVHTGQWLIEEDERGTLITSVHTVVIEPSAVTRVLGGQATVSDARGYVREALGRNSTTTMRHAKDYAEKA